MTHNMPRINTLLKISGLVPIISKQKHNKNNNVGEIVIVVKNNDIESNVIPAKNKYYQRSYIKLPMNYIYMLFVLSIILWMPIFSIYSAFVNKNIAYVTSSIFDYMYVTQYLFGVYYYQKDHYFVSLQKNKIYKKPLYIAILGAGMFSILISIISFILIITDQNTNYYLSVYRTLTDIQKVFFIIGIFFQKAYSYYIFLINVIMFFSVFVIHGVNIRKYASDFATYIEGNFDNLTIQSVIKDFSDLKEYHTESVDKLNNLFSSTSVIGIVASYFLLINYNSSFVGYISFFDIILFVVIEYIYFFAITRVRSAVGDISDIVNSPRFIEIFVSKNQFNTIFGDTYDTYKSHKNDNRNARKNSKEKIPDAYSNMEKKKTFDILNQLRRGSVKNEQDDMEKFKSMNRTLPKVFVQSENDTEMDSEKSSKSGNANRSLKRSLSSDSLTSEEKKINFIKDLSLRNTVKSTEIAESVDWLILNQKLNGEWANFRILGFQINDTDMAKKLIAIVGGFLMLTNAGRMFGL